MSQAVFHALERFTLRNWNLVLTAYLGGETYAGWLGAVERIAQAREASMLQARLICATDR